MNEREPIEIDIKLDGKDVLKFLYKLFFGRSILMQIVAFFVFCLILPLLSLNVIIRLFSAQANTIAGFAYLPLFALAIFIFVIVFVILSSKKNAKKTHLIFTEGGINITSINVASQIKWENYRKIRETKTDFFMFSTTPNGSFPIPKRCFKNESQIQEFKDLVREKLGDKAELK